MIEETTSTAADVRLETAFDPEAFRQSAHAFVDHLSDYLARAIRGDAMPVLPASEPGAMVASWPPIGAALQPQPVLERFLAEANHLHHPHYIGHQVPPPLPLAALCDMLISMTNNGMAVYEMGSSGTAMERRVIEWMTHRLGWGEDADGVLTSGGSVANLTALLAARNAFASRAKDKKPAFLVSEHAHYSVTRALKILGLDDRAIVKVPVDARFRMAPDGLEGALLEAELRGYAAIGVAANACTTATGVYDPLDAIGHFCQEHDLWFHVDAAHGAVACLSEKYRHLLKGIEFADTVVWDVHKMMLMPALASAVLYRRRENSYLPFSERASYLLDKDGREDWYNLGHRTFECTKRSIALKVYTALQVYGEAMFARYVNDTFDLGRRFAEMIREQRDFDLGAEPDANIVCFRYLANGSGDLDDLQLQLRTRLVESGKYYIVQTVLPHGRFMRATIINPFTTEVHLAGLLDEIRSIARDLS